jgi:hypothetical protein
MGWWQQIGEHAPYQHLYEIIAQLSLVGLINPIKRYDKYVTDNAIDIVACIAAFLVIKC